MMIPLRAAAGYVFGLLLALCCVGAYADLAYRGNAVHPGERERESRNSIKKYIYVYKPLSRLSRPVLLRGTASAHTQAAVLQAHQSRGTLPVDLLPTRLCAPD